jgi:Spy/CpxP family protein refolding chaperone
MWSLKQLKVSRVAVSATMTLTAFAVAWPLLGLAGDKPAASAKHQHAAKSKASGKDLAAQIRELRQKVARLEATLKSSHAGKSSGMGGMPGMGMGMVSGMEGKKEGMGGMMGMMDMDMMEMMSMMGMSNMKGMQGMDKMKVAAALPGFPGASHIYHVGATGFFLDHPEHIQLTTKQKSGLSRIKEKALLNKATTARKIDEAEQELWTLTASDQPDAAKIEAKVREIEKRRGDQRLAFIRAVGEAAKVLTDEQRQALLGTAAEKPVDHTGH